MSRILCNCARPGIDSGLHEEGAYGCCAVTQTSTNEAEKVDVKADESTPTDGTATGFIKLALLALEVTLASKNEDYRIDGEFSNFEYMSQAIDVSVSQVILGEIYKKLGRLKGLAKSPNNEPAMDTVKDLAGYAIILYAYHLSKEAE